MKPPRSIDSSAPSVHFGPIAIVGMGGVFPEANDLTTFWDNIAHKKSAVKAIPKARWIAPIDAMVSKNGEPDKAFTAQAALIDHFDFNAKGFLLPEEYLAPLDPLFHLTLEAGRQAFDAANTHTLNPARVGVVLAAIALPTDGASRWARRVVGNAYADQALIQAGIDAELSAQTFDSVEALSAQVTYLPAALLAAALGLKGSTVTLDAACASSLYAVKLACDQLLNGRLDAVLAGGVSRPDSLYTQVGFTQLKALSKSGCCAPFDQYADGLVVGEGAGIVLLKRLDDAVAHNDQILGVIRGFGLSNDLRGNLLAPDSEGQLRAMRAAYETCGWQPGDVDLIECHGAGTPLGDQTELQSLRTLWKKEPVEQKCAIGSVKSMVGHLLTAAGAASLIKTVLAIQHKTLPPSLNFHQAPANSSLQHSPFYVQTETATWSQRDVHSPRRAAINAFGFGGINAHLLLEEYLPAKFDQNESYSVQTTSAKATAPPKIAIVGLDAASGGYQNQKQIVRALLNNKAGLNPRPANRWRKTDRFIAPILGEVASHGRYMTEMVIAPDEFRMPPAEIPDIIPQHLLMLRVAKQAAHNAGVDTRHEKPRMGAIIGIDFDFEATDFHLRWALFNQVKEWNQLYQLGLNSTDRQQVADAIAPPLTYSRTLGALGSMTASRVARELRLGGPCFTISAGAVSGVHALQMAVDSHQKNETDTMIIGGVDLMGDVRAVTSAHKLGVDQPPADGAAAVVLKRLDDAQKNHDTIYAVVDGIGLANEWQTDNTFPSPSQKHANNIALKKSDLTKEDIHFTDQGDLLPQMGTIAPHLSANTTSAFSALVTASLSLYHQLLLRQQKESDPASIVPKADRPQAATVAAQTVFGQSGQVFLVAHDHATLANLETAKELLSRDGIRLPVGKMPAPFPSFPKRSSADKDYSLDQSFDPATLQ